MIKIFEDDKLKSGTKQIVLESDKLSTLIAPEVGGRIVGIQKGAWNFLHRTYPKGIEFGTYTEYGGIEECVGGAPGTLWNVPWIHEQILENKFGPLSEEIVSQLSAVRNVEELDRLFRKSLDAQTLSEVGIPEDNSR